MPRIIGCNKYGIPYNNVRESFARALKIAGITGFRFHDLRHTFGSRAVMSGVDIETVKELMGHKSIMMPMGYAHPAPVHKRMAVEMLREKQKWHF